MPGRSQRDAGDERADVELGVPGGHGRQERERLERGTVGPRRRIERRREEVVGREDPVEARAPRPGSRPASGRSGSAVNTGSDTPIFNAVDSRASAAAPTTPASLPSMAGTSGTVRPTVRRLHRPTERLARRLSNSSPASATPSADHDHLGIEHVHEAADPLAQPPPDLREDRDRDGVPVLSRRRHHGSGHPLGIAAAPGPRRRVRLAVSHRLSTGSGDRLTRRHLLPASAVPAAAQRPVGLHDDVADLGGEPVRAPEEPPVRDDPAADPGADAHQQHVSVAAARAEPELPPGGRRVVVVGDDREPERARRDARPAGRRATPGSARTAGRRSADSTSPAAAIPDGDDVRRTARARAASSIVASVASMSSAGVGSVARARIVPSARDASGGDLRAADVDADRVVAGAHPMSIFSNVGGPPSFDEIVGARVDARPSPRGRTRGRPPAGARRRRASSAGPPRAPARSDRTRRCRRAPARSRARSEPARRPGAAPRSWSRLVSFGLLRHRSTPSRALVRGLRRPAEQDLQVIAREVRLAHHHPLQRLRQDQVPLVGADAHEQLLAAAMDVHLVARHERQAHRQDVAGPALAHADRVVAVQDVGRRRGSP